MEKTMKNIIFKYLDTNFKLTFSSAVSFKVLHRKTSEELYLRGFMDEIQTVFDLSDLDTRRIFDAWIDKETIELNNLMVQIKEDFYNETGETIKGPINPYDVRLTS